MKNNVIFLIVIFILIIHSIAFSQVNILRLQREMTTLGGFCYQSWKAENDKINQFTLPVTFIYPVNEKMRINVTTSPAFTTLNTGDSYKLNGLSDMRIGGHYLMDNNKFLLTYGLNLPTGKNALSTEEFSVSNAMAIHALNFHVPSMGQGLNLNIGVATATQVGDYIIGGGISYLSKGTFEPFKDYDYDYNPGDEITFSAGLDKKTYLFGKDVRITGDIAYTVYGNDKGNKEEIFKSGNKFLIQCVSYVKSEKIDYIIYIKNRLKGINKTGIGDMFEEERKNSNGNEFEIAGQGIYPYSETTRLKGLLDIKFYGNNEYDTGGVTLFGLGGGGQFRYSKQMLFDCSLMFYAGSIKSTKESSGLTGIKLSGGIIYNF